MKLATLVTFVAAPLVLTLGACSNGKSTATKGGPIGSSTSAAPSATGSNNGPKASGSTPKPIPYAGKTAQLRGLVRVTGDPAPMVVRSFAKGCEGAVATHGRLFRVGQGGELADVLVAVTRYQGYVPPKSDTVNVVIQRCSLSTRTVALTDGQHIEVQNRDRGFGYIPYLDGANAMTDNVALPGASPIKLFAPKRGRYMLRDKLGKEHLTANVFRLPYATTSVTKLDGAFNIEGIPVGKVTVSAMLPAANMKTVSKTMVLKEGANTLDFVLPFDAEKDVPAPPATAPSATVPSATVPSATAPPATAPPATAASAPVAQPSSAPAPAPAASPKP